jgi:hypothetical protein
MFFLVVNVVEIQGGAQLQLELQLRDGLQL